MSTEQNFADRICTMNQMYKLNIALSPALPKDVADRLTKFKKTLMDEIYEIDDIIDMGKFISAFEPGTRMARNGAMVNTDDVITEFRENIITAIADVLVDITVFCRSESMKYGIPHEEVQDIVMDSNESKLADDGVPVYDENGKFQKDEKNYWKPENLIKNLLTCTGPIAEGNW